MAEEESVPSDPSGPITLLPWLGMLRASIALMNQELELLIRELMIQMALRKESWQGAGRSK